MKKSKASKIFETESPTYTRKYVEFSLCLGVFISEKIESGEFTKEKIINSLNIDSNILRNMKFGCHNWTLNQLVRIEHLMKIELLQIIKEK